MATGMAETFRVAILLNFGLLGFAWKRNALVTPVHLSYL